MKIPCEDCISLPICMNKVINFLYNRKTRIHESVQDYTEFHIRDSIYNLSLLCVLVQEFIFFEKINEVNIVKRNTLVKYYKKLLKINEKQK